jgi:hypothetical protein
MKYSTPALWATPAGLADTVDADTADIFFRSGEVTPLDCTAQSQR